MQLTKLWFRSVNPPLSLFFCCHAGDVTLGLFKLGYLTHLQHYFTACCQRPYANVENSKTIKQVSVKAALFFGKKEILHCGCSSCYTVYSKCAFSENHLFILKQSNYKKQGSWTPLFEFSGFMLAISTRSVWEPNQKPCSLFQAALL